jgi:membrane-associated phospholipid phosphatase
MTGTTAPDPLRRPAGSSDDDPPMATALRGRIPGDLARPAAALAQRPPAPIAPAVIPPRAALNRTRLGEVVALGGLAGFAALFVLVKLGRTAAIDTAITLRIQGRRHRSVEALMRATSWPGFPPQSRVIPPTVIGGLLVAGLPLEALAQTAAWGTALLSTAAKGFMGRKRPVGDKDLRVVAAPLGGSSFPSGHVLTYVGTYGFLAFLAETLVRPRVARRAMVVGLVTLIALVGPSRIQQGHHWPTDVTASYLLGTSYLVGIIALYRTAKARTIRATA